MAERNQISRITRIGWNLDEVVDIAHLYSELPVERLNEGIRNGTLTKEELKMLGEIDWSGYKMYESRDSYKAGDILYFEGSSFSPISAKKIKIDEGRERREKRGDGIGVVIAIVNNHYMHVRRREIDENRKKFVLTATMSHSQRPY